MSFPAMFKPIEIDSILAYDGGIYNNFPVNVMRDTFHPDIIIGSAVSANPGKPKEGDIMGQLEIWLCKDRLLFTRFPRHPHDF